MTHHYNIYTNMLIELIENKKIGDTTATKESKLD